MSNNNILNWRPATLYFVNLVGNMGAIFGNILFSIVIDLNCVTAFVGIGVLSLGK